MDEREETCPACGRRGIAGDGEICSMCHGYGLVSAADLAAFVATGRKPRRRVKPPKEWSEEDRAANNAWLRKHAETLAAADALGFDPDA